MVIGRLGEGDQSVTVTVVMALDTDGRSRSGQRQDDDDRHGGQSPAAEVPADRLAAVTQQAVTELLRSEHVVRRFARYWLGVGGVVGDGRHGVV